MANKLLKIQSENTMQSGINQLVYADLSLKATEASIKLKQKYINSNDSVNFLSANEMNDTDVADDFILYSNDAGRPQEKLMFFGSSIAANTEIAKYNIEARKKSNYKLQKNINVKAVQRAIHNIFNWIPGQRVLFPEFGTRLRTFLYEGITNFNKEQIIAEINRCISEWEPRARIDNIIDVSDVQSTENNTVKIEVVYSIPSLSFEQYSYTYEYTIN